MDVQAGIKVWLNCCCEVKVWCWSRWRERSKLIVLVHDVCTFEVRIKVKVRDPGLCIHAILNLQFRDGSSVVNNLISFSFDALHVM